MKIAVDSMLQKEANFVPIAIIGAGFSGIAAGCQIKEKLGFSQFKIFDRMGEVGGVWSRQIYPGVACDIPALLYSLSFAQNLEWSNFTPPGKEIRQYLGNVCKRYMITDNIQLNTEITHLQWETFLDQWRVTGRVIRHGKVKTPFSFYSKVVINAAGKFIEPNLAGIRELPGFEEFKGNVLHTSTWDSTLNLEGKNVLVVGSGCTAAQIVPSLLKTAVNVETVTQVMRSAPWVRPRFLSKKATGLWETHLPWLTRNIPFLAFIVRGTIFLVTESQFFLIFGSLSGRKRLKEKLLKYIQQAAPKKYHEILTPSYEVGCKRFVQDDTWFESLHDPRMHLTTKTLKKLKKDSVVLKSQVNGEEQNVPTDVIVLATGYDTSTFFPSITTIGKDNVELHQVWTERGGPQAYMGISIDKFPNLFLLGGPNSSSGHTSVIINIENGLSYILKLLRPIIDGEVSTWEIKKVACTRWTVNIQNASKNRVWKIGGCNNWYIDKNGWNGTVYPFSHFYNIYCMMFPNWQDWRVTYTVKGMRSGRHGRSGLYYEFLAGLATFILLSFLYNIL